MQYLLYLREYFKKERIGDLLNEFRRNENLSLEIIKSKQRDKLAGLLKHLNEHHDFYSKFFKKNHIDLNNILNDKIDNVFVNLPVTDKSFIKSQKNDWISSNEKADLNKATTSGSTGFPFEIYHSKISRDIKAANKFRLFKWNKINRWERQVYFGCTYGPPKTLLSKLKILVNDRFIWDKHVIDFTNITENTIRLAISKINSLKPVSIWGYPSVIYEVGYFILSNNISINNPNLKAVILSGESHTDHMKTIIRKAFNVNVIDEYNANEGFVAGTCEFGNLHLMEDTLIAEVLHEDGSISDVGHGELLLTFLYSYDFPFIRYKIGDIADISNDKCKCGRNLKLIKKLDGRKGSSIINGDNKISNATCNHYVTKSPFIDSIKNYQIVQNELNSVIVKLVITDKNRDYSDFENIMKGLFNKIEVKFEYLNEIPRQKSGKHIDVINNVH